MSKVADAITKIAVECTTPGFKSTIGNYLQSIITNDEVADRILAEKKTLSECCNEITSKAKKVASGGCAAVEDYEVYGWAREYFGINELMIESSAINTPKDSTSKAVSIFDYM